MSKANRIKREQKRVAPPSPPPARFGVGRAGWIGGGVLALVVVVVLAVFALQYRGKSAGGSTAVSGLQTGSAPWAASEIGLTDRMKESGVPLSDMSAVALHIHPLLSVIVDGQKVPVPANIGIEPSGQTMAALHTHDDSGTIHVESPVVRSYKLGEFFDVWGVRLTEGCLGGYCNTSSKRLAVYVGSRAFEGNPRDIELKDGEQLTLIYGTKSEIAANAP
jgi:hypothetical protein